MTEQKKSLHDYGEDLEGFLAIDDAEWKFTKGACHAFAVEFMETMRSKGRDAAQLYYISSAKHAGVANHVFLKDGEDFWDVNGKHTISALAQQYADQDESRIRPVGHVGWITTPSHTPNTSFLGLLVNKEFLQKARLQAKDFIATNPERFC